MEADKLAAAQAAAKKEAETLAARAVAKKEAEKLAAHAAAKKEAEKLAAAQHEAGKLAAAQAAAKKQAERQVAAQAAAKTEAEKQGTAQAAGKQDAGKQAAAQGAAQPAGEAVTKEEKEKQLAQMKKAVTHAVNDRNVAAVRSVLDDMGNLLPDITLRILVWMAAVHKPSIDVLKELLTRWHFKDSWTQMRLPANPAKNTEEKCIIHECVALNSKEIVSHIVKCRREALLERCPNNEAGCTPLRLALKQRASSEMLDILSPPDFPAAWNTPCGRDSISPMQEAKAMAGDESSQEAQQYYKVVLKHLQQKQRAAAVAEEEALRQRQRQLQESKATAAAPVTAPTSKTERKSNAARAAPAGAAVPAWPAVDQLARNVRQIVQELEQAVITGNLPKCKKCIADLEKHDLEREAATLRNAAGHLLWHACTKAGSLPILNQLGKLLDLKWEEVVFDQENNSLGAKTAMGGAIANKHFQVAEAALAGLKPEVTSKSLKLAALKSLRTEGAPLTAAIRQGAPLQLLNLIFSGYSSLKRTYNERNADDLTPLGAAVEHANVAVLKAVVEKADLLMKFKAAEFSSVSALYYAVHVHSLQKVEILLQAAAKALSDEDMARFLEGKVQRNTPLYLAVKDEQAHIAIRLFEAGASVKEIGHDGSTVLHAIVMNCVGDRPSDMLKTMMDCMPEASRPGYLNSTTTGNGSTVLHGAVEMLYPRVARYLMDQGASILAVNHELRSPFMLALEKLASGHSAMQALVDKVSEDWSCGMLSSVFVIGMADADRDRVHRWLKQHSDIVMEPIMQTDGALQRLAEEALENHNTLLLDFLAGMPGFSAKELRLHTLVGSSETPTALLAKLVQSGADISMPDKDTGQTLLHQAVLQGNEQLCTQLCDLGAVVTVRDDSGNTPLHMAVCLDKRIRDSMVDLLTRRDIMATLVKNKAGLIPSQCSKAKATKRLLSGLERVAKGKSRQATVWTAEHVEEVQEAVELEEAEEEEEEVAEDDGLLFPDKESAAARKLRVQRILEVLRIDPDAVLNSATPQKVKRESRQPVEQASRVNLSNVIENAMSAVVYPLAGTLEMPEDDKLEEATDAGEQEAAPESTSIETLLQRVSEESPWEFAITREARQEWAQMDEPYRTHVLRRLLRIGEGLWQQDGNTVCLKVDKALNLELWRTKFSKSGRIVFEIAVDYSERLKVWRENLRLWVITLDHDRYESRVQDIEASHRRSQNINLKVKLELDKVKPKSLNPHDTQRLPRIYHEQGKEDGGAKEDKEEEEEEEAAAVVEHTPAASAKQDSYTLLKFYSVSQTLLKTILQGMDDGEVDFPFRLSPKEQEIIEMVPNPPCSVLLLGRSGTGKTTCAVYRIWGHWMAHHGMGIDKPYRQVFLTASATLKEQVARAFRKLQTAALASSPLELAECLEAANGEYATLNQIPDAAYPLFLTTKLFTQMLDGTLTTPFFARRENGTIISSIDDLDNDGTTLAIALDYGLNDDDIFADDDFDETASLMSSVQNAPTESAKRGKQEVTYQYFTNVMWKRITRDREDKEMKPALIYQEIMSYIKGSSEALRSPKKHLSLEDYLSIGAKRAPNFSDDERRKVYPIFERYEVFRNQNGLFDNMDLIAHVFRSILTEGYKGPVIHSLYRDEVQDFTQAELLLDMRCVIDPNSLFYCGDTCQTIARGIGFRFTDIRTLLYEEAQEQRQLERGGKGHFDRVGVPTIEHLKTNYRTHSGIIDVASSIVDLLKHYFPRHIDNLDRERAFFNGPAPLLLSSLSVDDISILLSGSDRNTSQVEFGAHQVILVRNMDSIRALPWELQESRAIIMTVSQSKGLEFDDVFLVDFFHDSPAESEWRVLTSFIEEIENDEAAPKKLPSGKTLKEVPEDPRLPQGALRTLQFEESKHVLLCEELKHLYTAITRAKNNVVIFDQNPRKRAPFYHYLRRCGLARDVRESLLVDGADAAVFGLTKANSSAEEWLKRAENLFDNSLYDLASKSYTTAGDPVRALMSKAMAMMQHAHSTMGVETSAAKVTKETLYTAACHFVTAASNASQAPQPVDRRERQKWLKLAAQSFSRAGEGGMASQIMMALGMHASACRIMMRLGMAQKAAECAAAAADKAHAEGQAEMASRWRGEAFLQLYNCKEYAAAVDMLKRYPELRERLPQQAEKAMQVLLLNLHQRGKRDAALEASRLIPGQKEREDWLRRFGYWEELSQVMENPLEAAELLARRGDYRAAAVRLKKSMKSAAPGMMRDRLHGYLLQIGTMEAAKEALALWEGRKCPERGAALLAVAQLSAASSTPSHQTAAAQQEARRTLDVSASVYDVDEARRAALDGGLAFCLEHGLESCGECKADFRGANAAVMARSKQPALLPAASPQMERQLKLLADAEAQYSAGGDWIGQVYALLQAASVVAAADVGATDLDPDVPGCSVTLEKILALAPKLNMLLRCLLGKLRSRKKDDNAALAQAEKFFNVRGLASTGGAAARIHYRRDNVNMSRAMRHHAQAKQQQGAEAGKDGRQEGREGLIPPSPPEMLVSVASSAARSALASELGSSTVQALLQLARVNLRLARCELRSQECFAVPADTSQLTALHDRQINALLQALLAVSTASSVINLLGSAPQWVRSSLADARKEVVKELLVALYPPLFVETMGHRVSTLLAYSQRTFSTVNIKHLLPTVAAEICKGTSWCERLLDPNFAMTLWHVSCQRFLDKEHRTLLRNGLRHHPRMTPADRDGFQRVWQEMKPPLVVMGYKMGLAGLMFYASEQLRYETKERGVQYILHFVERCHLSHHASSDRLGSLQPASYMELLELCISFVMQGVYGLQKHSPPVILPRMLTDTHLGAGLLSDPSEFRVLLRWGELAVEGQLLHLVQLVVRLTCSADLPPMDARLGIDGARKLNLRMRGVILLGVLAANLMLSLASAPTPGLPKGKLEEMLVYIQRRMLGMVAEEDDSNELVASIRGLLEAKVIRNLLSALTRVTRLLGSELMECGVDGRVREFASWPAYATRSKSKQPSDQEAHIARIVRYGQTPTAWQNQPGEPIIRLDAPTAWRMSSEVPQGKLGGEQDDVQDRREAAAVAIQDRYRQYKRRRALCTRLRLWAPSFRRLAVTFCQRRSAQREAERHSAELEEQLEQARSGAHAARFDWVDVALGTLAGEAMADWRLCPVCAGDTTAAAEEEEEARIGHLETPAHETAYASFAAFQEYYHAAVCPALSGKDKLLLKLEAEQATARSKGNPEVEHECIQAGEALVELGRHLGAVLESLEAGRKWARHTAELPPLVEALAAECAKVREHLVGYREAARAEAFTLNAELYGADEMLPEDDWEDDWEEVTSKKNRRRGGGGGGAGGGGGGQRGNQPRVNERRFRGGRNH